MKLQVFSLYDEKAKAFNTPQYMAHKGEAIRALQTTLDQKESMIAKYPADYSLFKLGDFETNTGEIIGITPPELVLRAVELKADEEVVAEKV